MNTKHLQTAFNPRQYMLSKDFEIYYYNDSSLPYVAEHSHKYYEFYFFVSGKVKFKVKDTVYAMKKGDMLLIPPGVHHELDIYDTSVPYQRFVFWISPEYCRHLLDQSEDYGLIMRKVENEKDYIFHFDEVRFNTVQSKLLDLLSEIQSDRFGKDTRLSLSINDLVFHVNREIHEMEFPYIPHSSRNLYEDLLWYIDENLAADLSLENLSKHFYSSKYHIAHIFKNHQGISVHQYIIKKRLARCIEVLNDQEDLTTACLRCGFSDYSSFYRSFKKEYGMSPSDYKKTYLPSATGVKREIKKR